MKQLARDFADAASFFTVWVREAHPGGNYAQPQNIETRRQSRRTAAPPTTPRSPSSSTTCRGRSTDASAPSRTRST